MSPVMPDPREEEALYALLKPREAELPQDLQRFLGRLERELYARMTVEQIERLSSKGPGNGL